MQNFVCAKNWLKTYIWPKTFIENACGNNATNVCDENWVNQGFFKIFNTIQPSGVPLIPYSSCLIMLI